MKLVDVAEFYAEAGGGVRTYLDNKLTAGMEAGHEVVVVAPGPRDEETRRAGGRILWVKSPKVPDDPRYHFFSRAEPVHRVLDEEAPDVVEASSVYGGGRAVASWRGQAFKSLVFHQDPVAVLGHTFLDRFIKRPQIDQLAWPVWRLLARLGSQFDATVVAGNWLAERLRAFGLPRVRAVPFGIDPLPFLEAQPNLSVRRRLLAQAKLPSDAPLLVTVSRHHPEKRLPVLIEAVREIGKARPVALAIFGDGPQRNRIEKLAHKARGVAVAGYTRDRAELAEAVATADAMLHGSAAETYGLVLAEALAARTPLIIPNAGGAADFQDPDTTEVYKAGDAQDCAAAIRRMLSRDRAKLAEALDRVAKSGVRTLDDHFKELFGFYRGHLRLHRG